MVVEFEIDTRDMDTVEKAKMLLKDIVMRAGKLMISCFGSLGRLRCKVETEKEWGEAEEARLHYEERNRPDRSFVELKLELPGASNENVEAPPDKYGEKIAELIADIAEGGGGYEVYKTFIEFAQENLYTYTTPANEAKIEDSGGDYPDITVDVKYYG